MHMEKEKITSKFPPIPPFTYLRQKLQSTQHDEMYFTKKWLLLSLAASIKLKPLSSIPSQTQLTQTFLRGSI